MTNDGRMQPPDQAVPGEAPSGDDPAPPDMPSFDFRHAALLTHRARALGSFRDLPDASSETISQALELLPELCTALEDAVSAHAELHRDWRFLSHEIRKRLHLAHLASTRWKILGADERTAEEEGKLLKAMQSAVRQIPRLIDDLQPGRATRSSGSDRKRPVAEMIEELLIELHPLAVQKGAYLDAVRPLPTAPVDSGSVELVLLNLVDNALRHLDPERSERWVQLAVESHRGGWCFSVIDNGVGIPVALQERVFHENVRVSSDGAGEGLGLALARRIVHHQGGRIWIESQEGRGTSVRFVWPDTKPEKSLR